MKIFVTGANGFIGSSLVNGLSGTFDYVYGIIREQHLSESFFIAPVIGLIVIASIGLLRIGLLYLPFSPSLVADLLIVLFSVTALLKRKELIHVVYGMKEFYSFLLIPVFLFYCYSLAQILY